MTISRLELGRGGEAPARAEGTIHHHPCEDILMRHETNRRRFTMKSIEELRSEIEALKLQIRDVECLERRLKEERKAATPKVYSYAIRPNEDRGDRIWDPSCSWYRLTGHVLNKDEAEAAGHTVDDDGDGMNYLWNSNTQRFIMMGGGGRIWFGGFSSDRMTDSMLRALNRLAAFVAENPMGGDVTQIILDAQHERDLEREEARTRK